MKKSLRCWLGFHKYIDIKTQFTKGIRFGFSECEQPGCRVIEQCKKCGHIHYVSLNLCMPDKYLYREEIWA